MPFLKKYWGLIVVLSLSIFAILPFFAAGFFPIHDDTQVQRVYEMGKALKDGMFPVRWVQDLGYGYGYPIFNFYAPLAYYVGGFFNILGFDALVSTKIMMILGIMMSGIFMYFLAREFWGEIGGIVAGLFYLYAPYHAVQIYVRGDISEFWAYSFIPLIFYGLYKVLREQKWRFVAIGSLGFAGIILSHNLTAMMTTPFLLITIILMLILSDKRRKISIFYLQFSIFLLGLLLSAFYWFPALFEMRYTDVLSQIGGGANFKDHFVCLNQLWESPWGFGGSVPGCIDGLSLKIGKLHILLSIISILSSIWLRKKDQEKSIIILFSFFGLLLGVFFTLEVSRPIWEWIYLMAFFQYPWRFLVVISFFSSLLAGSTIYFLNKYLPNKFLKASFFIFLIFILLFFNLKFFNPQTIYKRSAADYTNDFMLKWTTSKISDEYLPPNFKKPQEPQEIPSDYLEIIKGEGFIKNIQSKTGFIEANINLKEDASLKVNIAYFPAWKIYIDDKITSFIVSNKGFIASIPKGSHKLRIKFEQTLVEKIANLFSLTGIIVLFLGIISSRKK